MLAFISIYIFTRLFKEQSYQSHVHGKKFQKVVSELEERKRQAKCCCVRAGIPAADDRRGHAGVFLPIRGRRSSDHRGQEGMFLVSVSY